MVIDVGPLDSVSVSDGVATIGAGAKLGAVYDALLVHGVTIAAGCGPEVGIAGLTLGGGLGIMGRREGLTCDQLLGAELVLADGRRVTCDEEREAELFWALRGAGGGHFGIVTEFTFRTVAAPEATAFDLRWERATTELVQAWQAWAPDAPDELAASLLISAGPDPGEPPVVKVFGAMLAGRAETEAVLAHLDPTTPSSSTARTATSSATWPAQASRRQGTRTTGRSSSARSCRRRRSPPSSSTSRPAAGPARRASSTSRPGAAPTTACRSTRPPSRIVTRASCSSMPPCSSPAWPRWLAGPLVGDRAPVGHGWRVSELPGARAAQAPPTGAPTTSASVRVLAGGRRRA